MKEKNSKNNIIDFKKIKLSTILYSIVALVLLWVVVGALLIYIFNSKSKFVSFTERLVPYPAAIINYSHIITDKELNENFGSVRNFYENQDFSKIGMRVDFSTSDGKKRLMVREKQLIDKMIEDKAIEMLARKRGIVISQSTVDQNLSRKLEEYGSQDEVEADLARLYNWSLADFKEKVVKPGMYKEELEKIIIEQNKDEFSKAAHEKIIKAQNELNQKTDFAIVAQKYSDGSSASQGGELGWFKKDQLAPEVAEVAFSLKNNEVSDIIESSLGYHIIELEDKKINGTDETVKLRQIFARKIMFADWLGDQMKAMKIFIPLKDYYWDKNQALVNFTSDEMKQFESNLNDNSQGDASVIF
jgi:hypothetical protein